MINSRMYYPTNTNESLEKLYLKYFALKHLLKHLEALRSIFSSLFFI